ncbi:MAG: hypothetical protein KGH79_02865 [Patescibacteria group bacterium]|nr:hypothetical protein [Patescibacteria group bacterium]
MRRAGKTLLVLAFVLLNFAIARGAAHAAASASILGLYPAAEVPIGAKVTFTVGTSGFTNPTFYLVDSFPGGVTSAYIDSAGDFSWTPNTSEIGTHNLAVTVSDSLGDSASASQTITVDGAASVSIQPPTPGDSVSIGTPVSFSFSSSGLFNPSYTAADSFFNSSVQSSALNAGAFNWTPIAQDIGSHTITVTAKDSYGNTAAASMVITVLPAAAVSIVELAPGASLEVGKTLSFTATSTGFIGPAYAVSDAFVGISTSTITIDTKGLASWTPQYNDIGVHHITVTVSDSGSRSGTATLSIKVLPQTTAVTQAPTPYASVPAAQTAVPAVTAPPAGAQTPVTKPTSAPLKQPAAQHNGNASAPQTQTAPLLTDAGAAPATSSDPTGANVVIPSTAPVESIGGFFLNSIATFFASLFRIF